MLPWLQRKERDSAYLSRLLLLAGQFVPPVRTAREFIHRGRTGEIKPK